MMTDADLRSAMLILYKAGTIGGGTYYVDGKPLCLAYISSNGREGGHCGIQAGTSTDHPGTGRCLYHGGRAGAPIVSGRYASVAQRKLGQLYQEFADDPDVMDLTPEVVMLRTLLARFLEMYEDADLVEVEAGVAKFVLNIIEAIGRNVERIERIGAQRTLTVTNAKLIMLRAINTATEIASKYVPEEHMDEFLGEFISAWRQDVIQPISITSYVD